MSEGASGLRGGRVRSFVSGRSAPQKLGALALVAVALTAPFGGLSRADTTDAVALRLHHRYDIGPFWLTFDQVETRSRLAPSVRPARGQKLLLIEFTVTNHTDRAELASLAQDAIGGDHTGAVPWPGDSAISPRLLDVADGSQFEGGEQINPGQTYQLVLVVPQARSGTPADFTLSLNGYVFQTEDATTLDPDEWVQRLHLAAGPVPVEAKP